MIDPSELARTVVLDSESRRRFETVVRSLADELLPQTLIERSLVVRMAVAHWRILRLWDWEKATLTEQISEDDGFTEPAARDAWIATKNAEAIASFRSQEAGGDRQFARSLDRLFKFRAARHAAKKLLSAPEVDQ